MKPPIPWIELGYMAKHVVTRPDWLKAEHIERVCSVSACVSSDFCDYTPHWKHNGFWLFNSPEDLVTLCRAEQIELDTLEFFYYQAYPKQYDEFAKLWSGFEPEKCFQTCVQPPLQKRLLGYDVVSYEAQNAPECSYLSCNHMAESLSCNSDCLFDDFDAAYSAVNSNQFEGCEPGPMRIIAVYTLPNQRIIES